MRAATPTTASTPGSHNHAFMDAPRYQRHLSAAIVLAETEPLFTITDERRRFTRHVTCHGIPSRLYLWCPRHGARGTGRHAAGRPVRPGHRRSAAARIAPPDRFAPLPGTPVAGARPPAATRS